MVPIVILKGEEMVPIEIEVIIEDIQRAAVQGREGAKRNENFLLLSQPLVFKDLPSLGLIVDAIERAWLILDQIPGSNWCAYSHSQGIMGLHGTIATTGIETQDGFSADPNGPYDNAVTDYIGGRWDSVPYSSVPSVPYYLNEATGWGLDILELKKQLEAAKDTWQGSKHLANCIQAIPVHVAKVLAEDNQREIVEFCKEEGLVLLADEDNIYVPDNKFHSFKEISRTMGYGDEDISLNSVPRTFAIPSFVATADEKSILVGEAAKDHALAYPANGLFAIKNLLGRRFDDSQIQELKTKVPYKIIEGSQGGRTFNITILEISNGVPEVKSMQYDTSLGGDDFDLVLVKYLVEGIKITHSVDIFVNRMAMWRLKNAAEKAKLELSSSDQTSIDVPYLSMEGDTVSIHAKNVSVDEVIMVGGMTKVPRIQKIVEEIFKKSPCMMLSEAVVAIGEHIEASMNRHLGDLNLTGLPCAPAGAICIKLVFHVPSNGVLTVLAKSKDKPLEWSTEFKDLDEIGEDGVKMMECSNALSAKECGGVSVQAYQK
ncbi:hypothetical protein RHGRI_018620 [Rhododendron griersonianum]|uniref:Uncharacterized protein n=1 Tax=Rhododendron griersonianum TaxID=479676 RepID=A0AAV6K2D5_9ERIC|nr:hypothetical protein RHGRI_018620 [Rhododendron griersonianum]